MICLQIFGIAMQVRKFYLLEKNITNKLIMNSETKVSLKNVMALSLSTKKA
jgi:hypothetical protein